MTRQSACTRRRRAPSSPGHGPAATNQIRPGRRRFRAIFMGTMATMLWSIGSCKPATSPPPKAGDTKGDSIEAGRPWFEERAIAAGLTFAHQSGEGGSRRLFPEISCGGAALFDMDNDGDLDAYLVQAGAVTGPQDARQPNQLFRNRGDGTFEDVTAGSGADHRGYGMGVAVGDYDNDGSLDLYLTNLGPNVLLRGHGDGTFSDVTDAAGVGDEGWGSSAAFLDYDADGDLDLFVVNYLRWSPAIERDCFASTGERDYCAPAMYNASAQDLLYRNNGDGTFTDVSEPAGLHTSFGNGLGVVCGDFNRDGRIDVFVANDGTKNQLWLNLGDGRFEDAAVRLGCAIDQDGLAKAGMGASAVDHDDDGDLDLLVVNLHNESDSFYRNQGGFFVDATRLVGLGSASRPFTRFGQAMLDFDNDGWLDVFEANGRVRRQTRTYADDPYAEPNLLLRGSSSGRFDEVAPRGGTAELLVAASRAAAFGDIDGDGALDILIVNRDGPAHLLRNIAPDRGHWIMFRVVDEHGRDAIGATVTGLLDQRRVWRDVRSAYSYCAANDPRVHLGLGAHQALNDVTVHWVDGHVERFGSQQADRVVTLRRGQGVAP